MLIFLSLWVIGLPLSGQVSGKITDKEGNPLPYASIYCPQVGDENQTLGTTSNADGVFTLNLPTGKVQLVVQYIGFETKVLELSLSDTPVFLEIRLDNQSIDLQEIVVTAGEDPAYAIVRKTMEQRLYHLNRINSYRCNSYVKGNIKMEEMPKAFMGRSLEDLGGLVDSSGQGILYLSEVESELFAKRPDKFRERLISSRVSGDDQGFGFNRAADLNFNLYETSTTIGRPILSPIAPGAFAYYRYQLIGTFPDASGRLIYKIKLAPRRTEDPVYGGHLYILSDDWLIQQAELTLGADAIKQPGLDSITIKQINVRVGEPDLWRTFSQYLEFHGGLLGFRIRGTFTAVFSDFVLEPELPGKFFEREVFTADMTALNRDSQYWNALRPIPLTREEKLDFAKKDSLQKIRNTPAYLDSLDREGNKFKITSLLLGYTWTNTNKKQSLQISSPLFAVNFNTIQGFNTSSTLTFRQQKESKAYREWEISGTVDYGLKEKILRPMIALDYQFNKIDRTRISLSGGRGLHQFNTDNPVSPLLNSLYSLLGERNYLKVYDHRFLKLAVSSEPINGIKISSSLTRSNRDPVFNNSDFSYRKKQPSLYTANNPIAPQAFGQAAFEAHQALIWHFETTFSLRQKYARYPKEKINYPSQWPEIKWYYQKGMPGNDLSVDFAKSGIVLTKSDLSWGIAGNTNIQLAGHKFLSKRYLPFMDYQHFTGNQTFWIPAEKAPYSFRRLPYYEYSTADYSLEGHAEHDFKGFILDKVPALRKLGFSLVTGTHQLYTSERGHYQEYTIGLDRLGIGNFRLFRIDFVMAKSKVSRNWQYAFTLTTGGG